jgi:phosphoglycerate dehydrogenase-like enzyme
VPSQVDQPASGKNQVAVLDDYQGVALEFGDWSALSDEVDVTVFRDHLHDADDVARRLEPFDIVVAMRERTPFDSRLLDQLPRLRLLVTTGTRNAAIDVAAANARGVVVSGTGGRATPTAELAWGLILAVVRGIPAEDASIRSGGWQVSVGDGLADKKLGVIGLGRLGSAVAHVGKAFGMEVVAWSQNLTAERAEAAGVRLVGKDELLRTSDVLTVHLVLSDRTRGMIGATEFAAMKPTAYFVNTSRGPIVDEVALVNAIRSRTIAGAALDVFDQEPLAPDHPLRSLGRTVVTPHIGYVERETYEIFYREIVDDIRAFLAGTPVRVIQP